jgi:EmrB/QacA subfamily drug resistance transporter
MCDIGPKQSDPAMVKITETHSSGIQDDGKVQTEQPKTFTHSWRVWCVFIVLCLLSFISAVDATIVTTSLPTITREIGGAELYVWIANSFVFASTVPQPLYGQIANIFGRKNPILVAISLFALGSGLAGGARNPSMLIAARTIQGVGSAGLYVLSDIIICDIVPPRHRASYLSAVLSMAAIGTTIGPIIGGALAQVEWRWIFWLNLPISGVGLIAILFLLNVKYTRSPTWMHALKRVDFLGNLIFIPSMVAIFLGLIMGGVQYPWGSWHIILPIILGVAGWIVFHFHQASHFCKEPSTPPRLFNHRTTTAGFLIIFLGAIIMQAVSYFLPVYFQAVKSTSPLTSGINFLPFALAIIPFGGLTGAFMSKFGRYIPLHFLGFVMCAVGTGLLSLLDEYTSKAAWAGYQIIVSGGVGIIFTATMPSTLASLPESDIAVATGTYSFVRSFGLVWGVTMASIIFNNEFDRYLPDTIPFDIRARFGNGAAYSLASGGVISSLEPMLKKDIVGTYVCALRILWLVIAAIGCLGFLCVFIEQHVELKTENGTEFGLIDKAKESDVEIVEGLVEETRQQKEKSVTATSSTQVN